MIKHEYKGFVIRKKSGTFYTIDGFEVSSFASIAVAQKAIDIYLKRAENFDYYK